MGRLNFGFGAFRVGKAVNGASMLFSMVIWFRLLGMSGAAFGFQVSVFRVVHFRVCWFQGLSGLSRAQGPELGECIVSLG